MKRDPQERHALDWPALAGAQDDVWRETERRVRQKHRRRARLVMASAGALVLGLSAWRLDWHEPLAIPAAAPSVAIVSMPGRQTLPDGSIVERRGGGPVMVAFTDTTRRVILEHGEAHFQVAKSDRPFVVVANRVEVRAVGTAFSIQLSPDRVEVLVTQGVVAVDRAGAAMARSASIPAPDTIALVDAGKRVVVDTSSEHARLRDASTLSAAELNARLAWRVPKLELTGTPLAEVVRAISEFTGTQLKLHEAALGQVRLSGVLRADNVDTLLQLLETNHGIVVLQHTDREIILGRR